MNRPSSTLDPSSTPVAVPRGSGAQSPISNLRSPTSNPYLFQGARFDFETGFYYFRNRHYDPETGRFLQRDPVWDEQNVGGWYTFVGNRPSARTDPLGLDDQCPSIDPEEVKAVKARIQEYTLEVERTRAAIEALEGQMRSFLSIIKGSWWALRGEKKKPSSGSESGIGARIDALVETVTETERLRAGDKFHDHVSKVFDELQLDLRVEAIYLDQLRELIEIERKKLCPSEPGKEAEAPEEFRSTIDEGLLIKPEKPPQPPVEPPDQQLHDAGVTGVGLSSIGGAVPAEPPQPEASKTEPVFEKWTGRPLWPKPKEPGAVRK